MSSTHFHAPPFGYVAGMDHLTLLLKEATGAFGIRVIGLLLNFQAQVLLARTLGAADCGSYVQALTALNMLSTVAEAELAVSARIQDSNPVNGYCNAWRGRNDGRNLGS